MPTFIQRYKQPPDKNQIDRQINTAPQFESRKKLYYESLFALQQNKY
jgi:hypothetical protein